MNNFITTEQFKQELAALIEQGNEICAGCNKPRHEHTSSLGYCPPEHGGNGAMKFSK